MTLSAPIALPNGFVLPNRLVKAAMAESMAESGAMPSPKHMSLYSQWANGEWGMVITGNVQVDRNQLGSPGDVASSNLQASYEETLDKWKAWAAKCKASGTPTVVQINHPGRQSPYPSRSGRALAPSPVPLDIGDTWLAWLARYFLFGTPQEMTKEDIETITQQFVDAAKLADAAGFHGVEIHGAHGYLLTQFMSSKVTGHMNTLIGAYFFKTNLRTDEYGGTPAKRVQIVREIIRAIRKATGPQFVVGIKINSADHQEPNGFEDSLEQMGLLVAEQVDFIEISGGSYERPDMLSSAVDNHATVTDGPPSARTQKREAFFVEYAKTVRERFPNTVLMVTGGFRSRIGINAALESNACDLVGLARPAALHPTLPRDILLQKELDDNEAIAKLEPVTTPWFVRLTGIKPLTAGLVSLHYQKAMTKLVSTQA